MPQVVPLQEQTHPLHIVLLGAQAIVFVTNSLTDRSSKRVARNTGGAAGFIAKFSTVFLYRIHTEELGYKPLSAFFSCQFRAQAPDMAGGLVRSTLR